MRALMVSAALVILSLASPPDIAAQRSGFIIGVGAGGGLAVFTGGGDAEVGVGFDFKIGGMIGEATQLYYTSRAVFFGVTGYDFGATMVGGLGVTHALPSAPSVHLNGAIGLADYSLADGGDLETLDQGLGLVGGVGYDLSELWMIDFNLAWGRFADLDANVFNVQVTVNILSR